MELHEKLFQLRNESGFTQQELAEKLNVSRQAISRWEMNSSIPSTENLISLSKIYDISINYLISEDLTNGQREDIDGSFEKTKNKRARVFNYVYLTIILILLVGLMVFLFTDIFKNTSMSFLIAFSTLTIFVLIVGLLKYLYINRRKS